MVQSFGTVSSTLIGIMWVNFVHLRPSGHIMPDHVGDRGPAHLDPGASRSPTYQAEADHAETSATLSVHSKRRSVCHGVMGKSSSQVAGGARFAGPRLGSRLPDCSHRSCKRVIRGEVAPGDLYSGSPLTFPVANHNDR
jgi:hypothetical protein